jgi:hypothetical protein
MIVKACLQYNIEGSLIAINATELVQKMINLIRYRSTSNPFESISDNDLNRNGARTSASSSSQMKDVMLTNDIEEPFELFSSNEKSYEDDHNHSSLDHDNDMRSKALKFSFNINKIRREKLNQSISSSDMLGEDDDEINKSYSHDGDNDESDHRGLTLKLRMNGKRVTESESHEVEMKEQNARVLRTRSRSTGTDMDRHKRESRGVSEDMIHKSSLEENVVNHLDVKNNSKRTRKYYSEEYNIKSLYEDRGNRNLSREDKTRINQLLNQLIKEDESKIFQYPVNDDIAPGYFDIVKHPIDISAITKKFERRLYNDLSEFKADLILMFDNCDLYNDSDSYLVKESKRLRKIVNQSLKDVTLTDQNELKSMESDEEEENFIEEDHSSDDHCDDSEKKQNSQHQKSTRTSNSPVNKEKKSFLEHEIERSDRGRINQFLIELEQDDKDGYFTYPVNEAEAPRYSLVIACPMDFETVK